MSRVDDSVTNQAYSGVIPAAGFYLLTINGYPANFTASLFSTAAGRKIEVSNDGFNYVQFPYDFSDTNNLWLFFKAKCESVKFTGTVGDRYGITTGSET